MSTDNANALIESRITGRLESVEKQIGSDVVSYAGPIVEGLPDLVKEALEDDCFGSKSKRKHLSVILETHGGSIEVAERLVKIFRHHYRRVDFVIPTFAMSAGTVLALSGDHIFMDYASTLGPIDPQVQIKGGDHFVPALGYLEQYNRFVERSLEGNLSTLEVAYFVESFDPAEISRYEHARELSEALIEEWLAIYKFKNWKTTETQQRRVTPSMRRERAKAIANKLSDTGRWHSHARGICMEVLRKELKLEIADIAQDENLNAALSSYWRLLKDYRVRVGQDHFTLNWRAGYRGF